MSLRVEQLERENGLLKAQVDAGAKTFATVAQVNEAIADVNRSLKSAVVASRSETLELVGKQIDRLAQQTDLALQALAKNQTSRAPVAMPA